MAKSKNMHFILNSPEAVTLPYIPSDGMTLTPVPEILSSNEYIALELVRSWALGLPNGGSLSMSQIIESYNMAIRHLEKEEK